MVIGEELAGCGGESGTSMANGKLLSTVVKCTINYMFVPFGLMIFRSEITIGPLQGPNIIGLISDWPYAATPPSCVVSY